MDLPRLVDVEVAASGQDLEPRRWVMCEIPLDLQRKLERRWAARFARAVRPVASNKQEPEEPGRRLAAAAESKKKPAELSRRA
jgi:hypothetical protein